MSIDNERTLTPQEAVSKAVDEITAPWHDAGLTPPYLVISEVARTAGLPEVKTIDVILTSGYLSLRDIWGQRVNDNLREAAIASAPRKRTARIIQSKGGPSELTALRMGLGRLRVQPSRLGT